MWTFNASKMNVHQSLFTFFSLFNYIQRVFVRACMFGHVCECVRVHDGCYYVNFFN